MKTRTRFPMSPSSGSTAYRQFMSTPATPDLFEIADSAMERYGFSPVFSDDVIRHVEAIQNEISIGTTDQATDLRHLLWCSIDNHDSKDLDQIQYCEETGNGEIRVLVAIADVDYYVKKGSPADRHAAHQGSSIYTGVVTYPMLPDRLSANISSLLPKQDKPAITIEYFVLPDGTTRHGAIFLALVENKAQLVYETIGDWLFGKRDVPEGVQSIQGLSTQLLLQNKAAEKLNEHRSRQGVLDLETIEATPVVQDGKVAGLIIQEDNPARSIIEEFMIAANRTLVDFLETKKSPTIQRIVRTPKNWEGIVAEAKERKMKLPHKPDARALARFLLAQKKRDPDTFPDLSLTIVKLIGPGEYIALAPGEDSPGHFALAVTDYTHGTAPNRRYVDLIIQRLVKAAIRSDPHPYTPDELHELADHLSASEKAGKKVERFMRKSAAAVLLQDKTGSVFSGIITGASEKGTYARVIDPPVEGRIVENEQGCRVGRKVRVRLLKTDPWKGFIDFAKVQG